VSLRALIVEDEPLARARLRSILGDEQGVAIVAEADNARTAAELVDQLRPDLIFLDIGLPEGNGFDLLRGMQPESRPAVIITTAHPQHALDAFEVSAADYLVKPLDRERVGRAVERARRLIGGGRTVPVPGPRRGRFAVRNQGEIVFVKMSQIDWVSAEGNYSRLHSGELSYPVRRPLQSVEESLDPSTFLRVHRSAIVNLDRVRKLVLSPDGTASIVLSTGAAVPLGPSYRDRLEEALGQKL
jgi:two-component system LytT family response regulator